VSDHNEHNSCSCGCHHDHHEHCDCEHHEHPHADSCGCGCGCGHDHDHAEQGPAPLIGGATLFAAGLVLTWTAPSLWALQLLVFLGAYLLLGWQVLFSAGKNLVKGRIFDENFLMSIATLGAFCIGEFPEAAGVMLFFRLGEYFEEKAVARSRSQIMAAVDLRPETVTLEDGSVIPAAQAQPGQLLRLLPGQRIGLDSTVVHGESRIDTAPITGEPVSVRVVPGDSVTSGCVNLSGQLILRVEKPLSESMVTRILQAVESAAAGKPKMDRFLTRFSRVYTPIVVGAAALTAVVPSLITGQWSYWIYTALSFLVMSCPCALVLSVPLAFFSGIGAGSRKGILFKGGAAIEALAQVKAVAVDKTGTVTKGEFTVQPCDDSLLALCAACEQGSNHPIARSIVDAAREKGLPLPQPESLEELPGHGIRAVLEGKTVLCGNRALLERFGVTLPENSQPGNVLIARDGSYLGALQVSDTLKPGAKAAFDRLKKLGLSTAMLTGDAAENAQLTARQTGIQDVFSRLLPEDKLTVLQQLRSRHGGVLFVGDGINDSPVLAGADVGAAMGSGADAAIEAADVVFMTSELSAIPAAVTLARKTKNVAWQNVIFALAVKSIVMVLGLLGFANMWLAVFADSGVALLCILSSIRLLRK